MSRFDDLIADRSLSRIDLYALFLGAGGDDDRRPSLTVDGSPIRARLKILEHDAFSFARRGECFLIVMIRVSPTTILGPCSGSGVLSSADAMTSDLPRPAGTVTVRRTPDVTIASFAVTA
jgi:hypothetical protein